MKRTLLSNPPLVLPVAIEEIDDVIELARLNHVP